MDYLVIVTDAAGNAVSGVKLTASVLPTTYYKGMLGYALPPGRGRRCSTGCANEDINRNGILDAGEDLNGNGLLDPGIPVTVSTNVTTDAKGQAIVSLLYPRDRVNWLDVNLTVRGQVNGSESNYTGLVHLPGLAADCAADVTPPGLTSPYGTSTSCSNPN
jgi:hypothetical protein